MKDKIYLEGSVGLGTIISSAIACCYCISVLSINIGNPLIPHIFFLLWILSALTFNNHDFLRILSRRYYLCFFIFISYYFVSSLAAFSLSTSVNRVITMFELISPFLIYELYSKHNKVAIFFIFAISIALILDVTKMYETIVNSAGLGLKQHFGDNDFLDNAFNIIYSLALLPGFFVYKIKMVIQNNYKNKFFIISLLIITILAIFILVTISMYATALFIMMLGMLLGGVYGSKRWKVKFLFVVSGILLFFLYLFPILLSFVSEIIPDSAILQIRIEEVYNLLMGSADSDASSSARLVRAQMSFNTFLDHPLFGITYMTSDIENLNGVILGNHTEWIDDLALFGIFSFFLFSFLWNSAKAINKKSNIIVVILLFILLGFFNKCFFVLQMSIVFIYTPFISNIIDCQKIQYETSLYV